MSNSHFDNEIIMISYVKKERRVTKAAFMGRGGTLAITDPGVIILSLKICELLKLLKLKLC